MREEIVEQDAVDKVEEYSSKSQDETSVDPIEYPTKFKLVMIVVALVLSMFLVSELKSSFVSRTESSGI
jgi:hypothetical protein